jgi:hypothetical protein
MENMRVPFEVLTALFKVDSGDSSFLRNGGSFEQGYGSNIPNYSIILSVCSVN